MVMGRQDRAAPEQSGGRGVLVEVVVGIVVVEVVPVGVDVVEGVVPGGVLSMGASTQAKIATAKTTGKIRAILSFALQTRGYLHALPS
jgi:hypothetical protein